MTDQELADHDRREQAEINRIRASSIYAWGGPLLLLAAVGLVWVVWCAAVGR